MAESNDYALDWFAILTYHKTKYVIYGVGQWWYHSIDWRGMNCFHGRLPDSLVFDSLVSAEEWLKQEIKEGTYHKGMQLSGHHAGLYHCLKGCDDREIKTIHFSV